MWAEELREAGLKVTVPRIKILQILEQANPHHLSVEDVYKHLVAQDEDIGLATIYRVLTQFEEIGFVHRHNFEGKHSVYELNMGSHHDHLVCLSCGTVSEFYDDLIEKQQQYIAQKYHFIIKNHHHTIYGICNNCHQ